MVFDRDGTSLRIPSSDRSAQLRPIPAPLPGDAARVALAAQLMTNLEIDHEGGIQLLDPAAWRRLHPASNRRPGPEADHKTVPGSLSP